MKAGEKWNGWIVDSLIGEGRFGKVYKIVRTEFGHTYESALKVMRIPGSDAEINAVRNEGMDEESAEAYFHGMVEEIVSEFTLMSEFRGNSNIVSYEDHQVVKHEGEPVWDIYIRMELLTPLTKHIHNSVFTAEDVIKLGTDMCRALELCQTKSIIHRDIKPENIFCSKTGNYKLGDFGIAREMSGTSAMTRVGTPAYMAPEIAKGFAYNSKADIYSLGIVLYRFLNNNRLPFLPSYPQSIGYRDREEANKKRMRGEPLTPPCNASPDLSRIILKACAYKPEDRYSSAEEMRLDLELADPKEKPFEIILDKTNKEDNGSEANAASIQITDKEIVKENGKQNNKGDRAEIIIDTSENTGSIRVAENKPTPVDVKSNKSKTEKKQKRKHRNIGKIIAVTVLVLVLILAALAGAAFYMTDYYLEYFTPDYEVGEISEEDAEYGFNGSWGYDEAKTKKLSYGDVTAYVPTNWRRLMLDMSSYGIEAEGRQAELRDENDNRIAWFKIEYLGQFDSLKEFDESERAENLKIQGKEIEIEGCDEARSLGRFTNRDGETLMANIVVIDGNVYWIGGGAFGENFSVTNYKKMLDICQYKAK